MVPAVNDEVSGMLYQIEIQFAEGRRADIEFIVAFEDDALVGASVEEFKSDDLDYEILAAAYIVG